MMTNIKRASIVFCLFLAASSFLTVRLYDLAVYDNTSKQVLSGQYTRTLTAAERSGFVYDTRGKLLSHEISGAIALVNPAGSRDKNAAAQFLDSYSEIPFEDILSKFSKPEPFIMTLADFPENKAPDGVYVYPAFEEKENSFCRHILGYRNSDGQGMDGIYGKFDSVLERLSGSLSYKYMSDAIGGMLSEDGFCAIDNGYTDTSGIVLTVDSEIQASVDRICGKYMDMGAVIVSNISTGEILALSSRPLYDAKDVASSLGSDNGELINRAFSLYTPGSVFKTAVAAAALETDPALHGYEYECTGECDVSGKTFKCHKLSGHGVQNMSDAFANSCNTYFINLTEKVGFDHILSIVKQLGLGESRIIDGTYIKNACLPENGKKFPPAYRANFSFGQGDILISPVDILRLFSICTTGYKRDLSLVKGIYNSENKEMTYFYTGVPKRLLSQDTVKLMCGMMEKCVRSGTGTAAAVKGVNVGGKTATAQSGQYTNGKEILHRWFAGVFPVDNPRYAIVVLFDGNGNNKSTPAKLFSEITADIYSMYG